jgi:hypothetical protein
MCAPYILDRDMIFFRKLREYKNLDLDVLLSGNPELNNEKYMEIFTCVQEYLQDTRRFS